MHNFHIWYSVSQCHPIYSVVFLAKGKTPTDVGLSGEWTKTDWSICTQSRLVFDIVSGATGTNGTNVQIYGYNNSKAQKFWFYTEKFGDVNMWVRTAQYSVSQDNDWLTLNKFIKYKKTGNIVTVVGETDGGFGFGGNDKYGIVGTLPSEYCPSINVPVVFHAMGGTSYNKSGYIDKTGEIRLYDRNNYVNYWGFCVSYPIQHSVSQISNRVLLYSGNAGKGANITINNKYSFKEFKSFYCLTGADKTIGLPLVRNSGIQQDQYLHGITGWDDGTATWTLTGLIKINTETTATVTCISKHKIDGSGGVAGSLINLWGYY